MNITAMCEVLVTVAVGENGLTDCCIADTHNLHLRNSYNNWLEEKRASKYFWAIKTVKVGVPYPMQYEDITSSPVVRVKTEKSFLEDQNDL